MGEYKKLPGRGRKGGGGGVLVAPVLCKLYTGSDHLLQVETTRITESYRRFYYRDIQGFVVRRTRRDLALNIIFGALLLMFGLGAYATGRDEPETVVVWCFFAVPCLLILIFNLLAGATCRTSVFTAVGQDELGSLSRLRRARKVLSEIRALIDAAQGPLDPQSAITQEGYVRLPDNPVARPFALSPERAARAGYRGGMHIAFFSILIGAAAACVPDIFFDGSAWFLLQLACALAGLVFAILALVRGHESTLRSRLSAITWTGAGFLLIWLIAAYVVTTVLLVSTTTGISPASQPDYAVAIEKYAALSASEHPPVFVALVISAAGFGFLGTLGLILVSAARRTTRPAPDSMIPPPNPEGSSPSIHPPPTP